MDNWFLEFIYQNDTKMKEEKNKKREREKKQQALGKRGTESP